MFGRSHSRGQEKDNDNPDLKIAGMKMALVQASVVGADIKPEPNIISNSIILTRGLAVFLAEY